MLAHDKRAGERDSRQSPDLATRTPGGCRSGLERDGRTARQHLFPHRRASPRDRAPALGLCCRPRSLRDGCRDRRGLEEVWLVKVRYRRRALLDIENIHAYITTRNPNAATEVVARIR